MSKEEVTMLLPSVFRENLFDDWFSFPNFRDFEQEMDRDFDRSERKLYGKHADRLMKTDVHEHEDHYEVDIDLPGFSKDEINLELKDGYLTVSAAKGLDKDETTKKGKLIRQERYAGAMQRSFYVGDNLTEEDIKASFKHGVLNLTVAKKDQPKLPEKKTITIE